MRESASLDFWPSVAKTLSYTSKYCRCYRMIQPRNTQHTTNSRSCCLGGVWRQRRQAQDGDGGNCCGRNHVAGPVQPCHACVAQHWWEVEPQPREGGGGRRGAVQLPCENPPGPDGISTIILARPAGPLPCVIPPGPDGMSTFIVAIGGKVVVVVEVGGQRWWQRIGLGQVLCPCPQRALPHPPPPAADAECGCGGRAAQQDDQDAVTFRTIIAVLLVVVPAPEDRDCGGVPRSQQLQRNHEGLCQCVWHQGGWPDIERRTDPFSHIV